MAQEPDCYPDPDSDYAEGRYVTCYSSEEFLTSLESIRRYTLPRLFQPQTVPRPSTERMNGVDADLH